MTGSFVHRRAPRTAQQSGTLSGFGLTMVSEVVQNSFARAVLGYLVQAELDDLLFREACQKPPRYDLTGIRTGLADPSVVRSRAVMPSKRAICR